jgi:hypothetical protein
MIKSRKMKWIRRVVPVGRRRMHMIFFGERQEEKDHEEILNVGGRMILNWIIEN